MGWLLFFGIIIFLVLALAGGMGFFNSTNTHDDQHRIGGSFLDWFF